MDRIRRYLSILLVLALLLTCVPAPVLAAEEPRKNHFSGYNDRYGNRGREDCPITESPEIVDRPDFSEFPTSFEEAGDVLRAGFVARQETIQVCIATPNEDIEEVFYEIWDEAMAHTGDPVEGDYIYGQWDYYYVEYETEWFEDKWYHAFAVVMNYYSDAQMEAEVTDAVDTLLNETLPLDDSMSDYEKVKIVYDWICSNVVYDYENVDNEDYLPQYTAYAALLDGVAVCNGYAVLLYRLLLELDIDCRMITGDAGGSHAWNIVALDGLYYNVDSTWDADYAVMEQPYEWFLLSPDSFVDHEREYEYDTADFHAAYPMAEEDYAGYDRPDADPSMLTGQCGDDVYWSLDEDGYLSIYGSGPTWDFADEFPGYFQYVEQINTCIIEEDVTGLGEWLFSGFYNLEWVEIPASVEYIRDMAFSNCKELYNVDFMGSAPEIADWAFLDSQTDIYYPCDDSSWDGVAGNDFGGDLTWIGFEDDEEDEEEWPVSGQCGDDVYWSLDEDGWLTISGTGATWDYPDEYPSFYDYADWIEGCFIQEGVTALGGWLFYECGNMEWVEIADSVDYIGTDAFGCCDSLYSVGFMGDAPEIDELAFDEVMADITYSVEDSSWNGVAGYDYGGDLTWLGYEGGEEWPAEGQCGDDVYWTLSDGGMLIYGTGDMWDFGDMDPDWAEYASQIVEVVVSRGVTSIGDYAFAACSSLGGVILPATISYVGQGAFIGCEMLEGIMFTGDAPDIAEDAFAGLTLNNSYSDNNPTWTDDVLLDYGGDVTWGGYNEGVSQERPVEGQCGENVYWSLDENGLLKIFGEGEMDGYLLENPGWLDYMDSVTAVEICDGVTNVGALAFWLCMQIRTARIAGTVESLDVAAFVYCVNLEQVFFEGDAPAFEESAFYGVTADCLYPAENTTWTGEIMSDYGGILTWIANEAGQPDQCGDNVYWSLNSDGLLTISGTGDMWNYFDDDPGWIEYCEDVRAVVIEPGVTSIGEFAFYDCPHVEKVTIPDSVSRIGRSSFDGCAITELTIPASVEVIGHYAFNRCADLIEIHFLGQAPDIAGNAFDGVSATAYYPFGPTWNNDTLWGYEGSLDWIAVGDDPWTVTGQCGDDVYWSLESNGLLAITGTGDMWDYPEEYPGWYSYRDILTKVVIHAGVTTIGDFAFYECSGVEAVTIHSSVSRIGESAFYYCNLTELTIPSGVKEIEGGAFKANHMTSVTIPASVEIISDYAFADCDLTEIRFMGAAPAIADYAFEEVTAACYYPYSHRWSEDLLRHYGGRLNWIVEGAPDEEPEVPAGDVDGSGTVDSDDAIYLLYYTLFGDGLYPVSGDCDYDGSGSVDSDDAIYLLYYTLFGDALYPLK